MTINPTNWLMLFWPHMLRAFRAPTMGEMYNDSKHFSIGRSIPTIGCQTRTYVRKLTKLRSTVLGYSFDDLMLSNDALEFKASYFGYQSEKIISPRPSISGGGDNYVV